MKKFFAAAMASAMVVSMASVSFAALTTEEKATDRVEGVFATPLSYDSDKYFSPLTNNKIAYGNAIYYQLYNNSSDAPEAPEYTTPVAAPLPVTKYDAVKGTSIKQKWEMSGTAIEKVEIVKKKYGANSSNYAYYLSVKAKANTTTSTTDVVGTVTLRKTGTDGIDTASGDIAVAVEYALGYTEVKYNSEPKDITNSSRLFNFAETEESTLNFKELDGAYFDVETKGQSKIVLKADVKYNADVANKYPNANIEFFNGNGATFNKTGTLTIPADKGSFLYLNNDGVLTPVKATYDEYEEAFKFKTRTLGTYIISDAELKTTSTTPSTPDAVEPDAPVEKPNPGTGARA